VLAMGH